MSISDGFSYPQTIETMYAHPDFQGLTKREYFAGLAMQGMIARYGGEHNDTTTDAIQFADALLEALNESK